MPAGRPTDYTEALAEEICLRVSEGESLDVDGWELRVTEMDNRRIAKVVAKRLGPPSAHPEPDQTTDTAGSQPTSVG